MELSLHLLHVNSLYNFCYHFTFKALLVMFNGVVLYLILYITAYVLCAFKIYGSMDDGKSIDNYAQNALLLLLFIYVKIQVQN